MLFQTYMTMFHWIKKELSFFVHTTEVNYSLVKDEITLILGWIIPSNLNSFVIYDNISVIFHMWEQ